MKQSPLALAIALVAAAASCASGPRPERRAGKDGPRIGNLIAAPDDPSAPWPWSDGQRLQVTIVSRGQRNVDARVQRWNMTLEQRWQVRGGDGGRLAITVEPAGDWRGEPAAPDAHAGSAYYLGFVRGLVIAPGGRVVSVIGGPPAREQARRKVEALRHLEHIADAALDRAVDDAVLLGAWSRLLRRLSLRAQAAGAGESPRRFTESGRFSVSGDHPIPVTYQLTREPGPCGPDAAPDSCLRIDLAGRADPAAMRAGNAATTPGSHLDDVSRETRAWLLLRGREVVELGDRILGHDLWKGPDRMVEARMDDEVLLRFAAQ